MFQGYVGAILRLLGLIDWMIVKRKVRLNQSGVNKIKQTWAMVTVAVISPLSLSKITIKIDMK